MMPNARIPLMAALAASLVLAPIALAVQPDSWVHTTEADFTAGETEDTVVTNLGDIKLSAGTETLAEGPEDATVFNDLQALDGVIYVAAGPRGALLRKQGDELETVVELGNEQVFALDVYNGQLLVAASGEEHSRLAVLEDGELTTLVELEGVRYIWDTLVRDDGIVIATGIEGMIYRVVPEDFDAEAEENPGLIELLDAAQANVLVLDQDGRGRLYAGTDTDGLVFRLTPTDEGYEVFVLYDAPEPEIGALLALEDGTVYAGTADAEQARPGRLAEAETEQAGRPEVGAEPADVAPEEPDVPDPGDLPQVPPGAEPIGDPDAPAGEGDGATMEGGTEEAAADPAPAEAEPATEAEADAPAAEEGQAAAAPTQEQYDRLRALIRQRLEAAREGGPLQVGAPRTGRAGRATTPAGATRARPAVQRQQPREGNAVYRIDRQGFVAEIFRESVMILNLVRVDDRLLVASGNEGQMFLVDPRVEETTTVADVEPEQITATLVGPDGEIMLATANPAQLLLLGDEVAQSGTYTSQVMDASQISLWGTLQVVGTIPAGARVAVQTRSGNVGDPEHAPWSDWTEPQSLEHAPEVVPLQPRELRIDAPPARFLQYRLTLEGTQTATPVVDQVKVTYVTPNMRPRIASITVTYPEPPQGTGADEDAAPTNVTIEWEASDPNEDTLVYRLEYQPSGTDRWLLMEEDLRETRYEWQTRRVPNGRYLVRVIADDRLNNPGDMALTAIRRSDPVLVDNDAPRLEDLEYTTDHGQVTIAGAAADELSQLASIAYVVNSEDEYQPILPEDLIFDSTRETFIVRLSDLAPGPHVVTLRVRDTRGNTRYEPVLIDINR